MPKITSKPLRTVLRWQLYVTAAIACIAAIWRGPHESVSAILGGCVSIVAGWVYAVMISSSEVMSAGESLRKLIRAEAAKIGLIVLLLWLILTTYKSLGTFMFFTTFFVTTVVFSMALFVREK